ncbi:ion channel [Inquilinus sp. CA228]|uniref:potassium channel family protein n=1 Tax=Inquilinus sp. CA228 TaxID=3455609 RepID=UPI003F8D198C
MPATATAPSTGIGRDRSLSALVGFEALAIFVFGPLATVHDASRHIFVFNFCFIVLAGIFAVARHTRLAKVVAGLGVLLIPLQPLSLYVGQLWLTSAYILLFVAFLMLLSWVVLVHVFRRSRINLHCILGAIAVYLHLGLIFALLGTLLVLHVGDKAYAFADALESEHVRLLSRMIYFSFTTLTSVGYGDITPVFPLARSLANLEGLCGQLFPAILLARLVSMELESRHAE